MKYKNETDSDIIYTIAGVEYTVEPEEIVNIPVAVGRKTELTKL